MEADNGAGSPQSTSGWWHQSTLIAADAVLAVAFVIVLQLEIWVFDPERYELSQQVLGAMMTPLAGGALAFRRTHTGPAFAVNGVAVFTLIGFVGPSDFYQFTNLIALYSASVHGQRRLGWLALPVSLVGVSLYFARYPDEGGAPIVAMVLLIWVVVWLMGRLWGGVSERERLRAERDLSVELAEARRTRLELEAERTNMARELHDIIGHTLNVMLVHAGAARRALPGNVAQATEAIGIIETTGRSAMDDLDRVLGLLRAADGEAPHSPLPGLDDLLALAVSVSDAELTVTVDLAIAAASVPKPAQLTVYRIAQEALTNVLKHAGATTATVTVSRQGPDLALDVRDNGRGLHPASRPGRGLTGMEQRAAMHGGTLAATPNDDGGMTLRCRIPMPA